MPVSDSSGIGADTPKPVKLSIEPIAKPGRQGDGVPMQPDNTNCACCSPGEIGVNAIVTTQPLVVAIEMPVAHDVCARSTENAPS